MELFKEKEESDVVKNNLDPDGGRILDNIDYSLFKDKETIQSKAFKDLHKKEKFSDIQNIEEEFKHPYEDIMDANILNEDLILPDEYIDTVVSVEDLIEFLDESEKEI